MSEPEETRTLAEDLKRLYGIPYQHRLWLDGRGYDKLAACLQADMTDKLALTAGSISDEVRMTINSFSQFLTEAVLSSVPVAVLPPAPPEPQYTWDDSWKPFPDFGEPTCSGTNLAERIIRHINSIT